MRSLFPASDDECNAAEVVSGEPAGQYGDALGRVAVLLAAVRRHPAPEGARARFSGRKPSLVDGPFPETKQ